MTPEETGNLADVGISILLAVTWLATISILQGIFIVLFGCCAYTFASSLISQNDSPHGITRKSTATFLVALICFLSAVLHWSAEMSLITLGVRSTLVNDPDFSQNTNLQLARSGARIANRIVIWTQFLPLVTNAVIFWRTSAVYANNWQVMLTPFILLLATIAFTFAFLGLTSTVSSPGFLSSQYPLINNVHTAMLTLSFASNALCTALVTYKLWTHRKSRHGHISYWQTPGATRILLSSIESGAFFCLLQATIMALSFSDTPGTTTDTAIKFASEVVFAAYIQISAMYPTLIILVINLGRSFVDTYGFNVRAKKTSDNTEEGKGKVALSRTMTRFS